jgi:hypothetical protein
MFSVAQLCPQTIQNKRHLTAIVKKIIPTVNPDFDKDVSRGQGYKTFFNYADILKG